jgi:AbrB family looped-hinge helix DNA binding protein
MRATIDDAGRILLPEDVRLQLGVEPGDDVVLEKQGEQWVINPASRTDNLGCHRQCAEHQSRVARTGKE